MSINCSLVLPPAAQVRDVAVALVHLTGGHAYFETITSTQPFRAAYADYQTRSYANLPECLAIEWIDGQSKPRHVLYHFEWTNPPGHRGIILRSTPEDMALACRMVDIFGGTVDFQDCDETRDDYTQPSPSCLSAQDGDAYDQWQTRLLSQPPLSPADIAAYRDIAAS